MKTINELLTLGAQTLKGVCERPRNEAMLLLAHLLQKDKLYFFTHANDLVEEHAFLKLLHERAKHVPLEYLTHTVSFFDEQFFIAPGALIPRPETEVLIEKVLTYAKNKEIRRIAEIGVGSGIISITLAKHLPNTHFIASDISAEALLVAKENVKRFGLEERIKLVHTSLLDGITEEIDVLVSNPPYIANDEKLDKNLDYEPDSALFGGVVGDELLKEIILLAKTRGVKFLACEMGYDQQKPLQVFCEKEGITDFAFYKDLAGLDRGFCITFKK